MRPRAQLLAHYYCISGLLIHRQRKERGERTWRGELEWRNFCNAWVLVVNVQNVTWVLYISSGWFLVALAFYVYILYTIIPAITNAFCSMMNGDERLWWFLTMSYWINAIEYYIWVIGKDILHDLFIYTYAFSFEIFRNEKQFWFVVSLNDEYSCSFACLFLYFGMVNYGIFLALLGGGGGMQIEY